MLLITYEAMLKGEDPREKILAIRIYEKKIDDIKFNLFSEAQQVPIESYWKGQPLSALMTRLPTISDIIEDASDHLQIIHVSIR